MNKVQFDFDTVKSLLDLAQRLCDVTEELSCLGASRANNFVIGL